MHTSPDDKKPALPHLMRTRTFVATMLCATICALLFVVQKTDALDHVRLLASATPLYGIFLVLFGWALWWAWRHSTKYIDRALLIAGIFLPASLLITLAPFFATTHITATITALTGFHICIYGILAISYYIRTTQSNDWQKPVTTRIALWQWALLGAVMIIYSWFAFHHLGNAFYVDEKLWVYERIENYWDNLRERDWLNTRPSDKPGITTALVTGPGLLFHDPSDFKKGKLHKELLPDMFFALRAPQVIAILLMIIAAFFLTRHIIGTRTALMYSIFLTLSPLLLGISRIINPDALLWIFFILGFLWIIRYLQHERPSAIITAGVFVGLALLTKYIANIFILFFLLILFIDLALRDHDSTDAALRTQRLRKRAIHAAAMVWIALSVFYVLYPGTWVKHDRMLLATIHSEAFLSTWKFFAIIVAFFIADLCLWHARITRALLTAVYRTRTWLARGVYGVFGIAVIIVFFNVLTDMSLYNFTAIIESPKSSYTSTSPIAFFLASFYPLLFGVTPFVLIGALIAYARRAYRPQWHITDRIVLYGALFILIYYTASLMNHVAPIIRYQIIIYPLFILTAAIGWNDILRARHLQRTATITIFIVFLCIGSLQLATIAPFYFSYNSPLLPQQFIINTKDMGDGNYEIAQWLNARPAAADMIVWTDKAGVCQFFIGTCITMTRGDALLTYAPRIDYYIVSQNRRGFFQRTAAAYRAADPTYPIHLDRLYDPELPTVYTLHPSGRQENFMRIIDSNAVSITSNNHIH